MTAAVVLGVATGRGAGRDSAARTPAPGRRAGRRPASRSCAPALTGHTRAASPEALVVAADMLHLRGRQCLARRPGRAGSRLARPPRRGRRARRGAVPVLHRRGRRAGRRWWPRDRCSPGGSSARGAPCSTRRTGACSWSRSGSCWSPSRSRRGTGDRSCRACERAGKRDAVRADRPVVRAVAVEAGSSWWSP